MHDISQLKLNISISMHVNVKPFANKINRQQSHPASVSLELNLSSSSFLTSSI